MNATHWGRSDAYAGVRLLWGGVSHGRLLAQPSDKEKPHRDHRGKALHQAGLNHRRMTGRLRQLASRAP